MTDRNDYQTARMILRSVWGGRGNLSAAQQRWIDERALPSGNYSNHYETPLETLERIGNVERPSDKPFSREAVRFYSCLDTRKECCQKAHQDQTWDTRIIDGAYLCPDCGTPIAIGES